jgi:hypothetical protein
VSNNYSYQRPSDDELMSILRFMDEEIHFFIHYVLGLDKNVQYCVCGIDLIDAIIRVDKRLTYFRIFHDMEINECKKVALYAYWIIKFRPIKIFDSGHINKSGLNDKVNELFAIHLLISALVNVGKIILWDGNKGVNITMENPYVQELCYSFRYRNFTIDSIIVLADSITTDSFRLREQEVLHN